MDIQKLVQIIMKWSIESQEWETVLALYTIYGIGIPSRYVYNLPTRNKYNLTNIIQGNYIELYSTQPYLKKLFSLFSKSKWKRLKEWNNSYGYSYL